MAEVIEYKTHCHPEANGRKAQPGEEEYRVRFKTDDGKIVSVRMGQEGYDAFTNMAIDMAAGTPSYDDGSLPNNP